MVSDRQPYFKSALLLLTSETTSCFLYVVTIFLRYPFCLYLNTLSWFVALYLGHNPHESAWCQVSSVCVLCFLYLTTVTHHITLVSCFCV